METTTESTVGEIVAEDYRAAEVFEKYGIDFCCNGNKSLNDACAGKNIETSTLLKEIEENKKATAGSSDFQSWPLDLLIDYIIKKHHRYVEQQTPTIKAYLDKINTVHGQRHPELAKIKAIFDVAAGEFAQHMKKEELMLFPQINKLVAGKPMNGKTVAEPINKMMAEHDAEGEHLHEIARLSNNYTTPADGCNTYKLSYQLLKEFEDDMHLHIHLENNILFPKAIKLEQEKNA